MTELSPTLSAHAFVEKWGPSELKERSAAQEHFIDLCHFLGEPTPADIDPKGEFYCFERGAAKEGGGDGWADVWKRGHFGWEYKGKKKDLPEALYTDEKYIEKCEMAYTTTRTMADR